MLLSIACLDMKAIDSEYWYSYHYTSLIWAIKCILTLMKIEIDQQNDNGSFTKAKGNRQ